MTTATRPQSGMGDRRWTRFVPDRFLLVLAGAVVLASILPVAGRGVAIANAVATAAIALLFFLNGVKLPRAEVIRGMVHWRLQGAIFALCFGVMPVIGLALSTGFAPLLPASLSLGLLFLGILPSTVQSATVASSMAQGNVAAAVVAAALLNLAGVVVSPLLLTLLAGTHGVSVGGDTVMRIVMMLLIPFIAGQVAQPWLRPVVVARPRLIATLDRGSIAIAVYVAFSAAVVGGIWTDIPTRQLFLVLGLTVAWLLIVTFAAWRGARAAGFARADAATLTFSGTQKSIAVGAPLAALLFPGATGGIVLLPALCYHGMQLVLAAWAAPRLARAAAPHEQPETA